MEVRAGTGGDEAALFAQDLLRMYMRYAERHRWKTELMDVNDTGIGGIKEAVVLFLVLFVLLNNRLHLAHFLDVFLPDRLIIYDLRIRNLQGQFLILCM